MLLAKIIERFEPELLQQYSHRLLPGHLRAITAMKQCRSDRGPKMLTQCLACGARTLLPHSCGHRNCPHCQHFESQRWLQRQLQKLLPVKYYLITFTLPQQMRTLAWHQQRIIYDLLFKTSWDTLESFGLRDQTLQGQMGATVVLHTHSRKLDYHPHIHMIVPAGALDRQHRLWRTKSGRYLFNANNLSRVYRAKWLQALKDNNLKVTATLPHDWVVDCKQVGSGHHALTYLGKYLYRGVLSERDILAVKNGEVTFRYKDNTGVIKHRILPGADFLWLLLQHVLPKGFRRTRDYGFLHANSKALIRLIQLMFQVAVPAIKTIPRAEIHCPFCGGTMVILKTRIKLNQLLPDREDARNAVM